MEELLRHDLIEKSYLFDEKGLMLKPNTVKVNFAKAWGMSI